MSITLRFVARTIRIVGWYRALRCSESAVLRLFRDWEGLKSGCEILFVSMTNFGDKIVTSTPGRRTRLLTPDMGEHGESLALCALRD